MDDIYEKVRMIRQMLRYIKFKRVAISYIEKVKVARGKITIISDEKNKNSRV